MKSFVKLRISGVGLNLQEISDQLGLAPDQAYKKGDACAHREHGGEAAAYHEDCWMVGLESDEDMTVEENVERLVSMLISSSVYLKALSKEHNVTVWVSAYPDAEQANIHIAAPTIAALSEIGAALDCSTLFLKDFYDGGPQTASGQ